MKRILLCSIAFAGLAAVVLAGCIFSPTKTDPIVDLGDYKDQDTPENVINNLQVAYRRKEIERYAPLLRHDFIFKFQDGDVALIGTSFWTRDQDSTGTGGLFSSNEIANIRIDLTHGPARPSDDLDLPDAMKIRVAPTKREVEQLPDIILLVDGDIQDFFLEKGDPEFGENPDWWYIVEWRDLPDAGGVGAPGLGGAAEESESLSWSMLRFLGSQTNK